jgi:hypothetical protein
MEATLENSLGGEDNRVIETENENQRFGELSSDILLETAVAFDRSIYRRMNIAFYPVARYLSDRAGDAQNYEDPGPFY